MEVVSCVGQCVCGGGDRGDVNMGFQTQEAEEKEIIFIPSVQNFPDYKNSFFSSEQQFSLSFHLFEDTSGILQILQWNVSFCNYFINPSGGWGWRTQSQASTGIVHFCVILDFLFPACIFHFSQFAHLKIIIFFYHPYLFPDIGR